MKIYNFSPGPSLLPQVVLEEAAQGILNYNNTGLSFLELSHRAKDVVATIEEATALVQEIIGLTDDYEVVWMTGGASSQLFIAPMNFLNPQQTAAYIDTGFWAIKAIEAAEQFGKIKVLATSKDTKYDRIPKEWQLPRNAQYLHLTSNNTIDGTQYHTFPDISKPIVCDMSSDFMSRPIPFEKFGLMYAGAQKNIGTAGTTCVIIRKDMLERTVKRPVPTILNYKTFVKERSIYNTPPIFAIYVAMLTMRWIKAQGGLVAMEKHNTEKAAILYNAIDQNPLFTGSVVAEDRSQMNVCFVANQPKHHAPFVQFAKTNGVVSIEGFPTVGGFRASMYNAMPKEGVQVLANLMHDFAQKWG